MVYGASQTSQGNIASPFGGYGGFYGNYGGGCGIQPVIDIGDVFGGHRGHYGKGSNHVDDLHILDRLHSNARDIWEVRSDTARDFKDTDTCVYKAQTAILQELSCKSSHFDEKLADIDRDVLKLGYHLEHDMREVEHAMDKGLCALGRDLDGKIDAVHRHISTSENAVLKAIDCFKSDQKEQRIRELELQVLENNICHRHRCGNHD